MMSFWVVPDSAVCVDALLLGRDDVERQQPRRRRVDRHRRVHLVERDAVHQRRHVPAVRDRHADLADLAARELVVGVVARLRRQVERDGQPGLALGQVAPVELIGLGRRGVPRVRTHHPRPVPFGQPVRHSGKTRRRYSIRPRRMPSATAAARSATSSRSYRRCRWVLIVEGERCSSAAICGRGQPVGEELEHLGLAGERRSPAARADRAPRASARPGRIGASTVSPWEMRISASPICSGIASFSSTPAAPASIRL